MLISLLGVNGISLLGSVHVTGECEALKKSYFLGNFT